MAGGALLEFAATLPLFFALILAVVDFSNYLNDRLVLTGAAYNGAKAGAGRCGSAPANEAAARAAVDASVADMLAVAGPVDLTASTSGANPVRRYVVTLAFRRDTTLLSTFTAHLFETIRTTGVAVCAPGCACNG